MTTRAARLGACVVALLAGLGAVTATADDSASIRIDKRELGLIRTTFVGEAGGGPVTFYERLNGTRLKRLGTVQVPSDRVVALDNATTWSCTRRTRRFLAIATRPNGSTVTGRGTVRTPACTRRFRVRVPRVVTPGTQVTIRVVDRWGNGRISPTLCVTSPAKRKSCRRVVIPNAVTIGTRSFRATKEGTWRIELTLGSVKISKTVRVDPQYVSAASGPSVLATGDSLMLGVDRFLGDELAGRAQVIADARPGRGISKWTADWTLIAGGQVLSHRPAISVMLIGGADGYAMMTPDGVEVQCCELPWELEYTRRARVMMETYIQGGSARVIWATMALPRDEQRLYVAKAVNRSVVRAAASLDGVSIVRLDRFFTPDGYSRLVRYRGRLVVVREDDGLHLNFRGQAIAAKLIAELIRGSGS